MPSGDIQSSLLQIIQYLKGRDTQSFRYLKSVTVGIFLKICLNIIKMIAVYFPAIFTGICLESGIENLMTMLAYVCIHKELLS
jgi:hypothetical protein